MIDAQDRHLVGIACFDPIDDYVRQLRHHVFKGPIHEAHVSHVGKDLQQFCRSDDALDDIITKQLYLPVGRPALIRMRTHDVIHSFFVPDFRVKQDLIPGFATEVKFTPTIPGEYELACTELCGLGHYTMNTQVQVMEADKFNEWLASQRGFLE